MRIVFLGNDHNPISVACLEALAADGRWPVAVAAGDPRGASPWQTVKRVWQRDGPGFLLRSAFRFALVRARALVRSLGLPLRARRSLHEVAQHFGLEVIEFEAVNARSTRERIAAFAPDLLCVGAFGQILKRKLIELPALGCLNVHPSLLPAYRGPNPFYWVLRKGEARTGVSIHWIDEGIDTGDLVLQRGFEIARGTTERDLRDRSAALGAEMLVEAVSAIEAGRAGRVAQPEVGMSYYGSPPRGKSTL